MFSCDFYPFFLLSTLQREGENKTNYSKKILKHVHLWCNSITDFFKEVHVFFVQWLSILGHFYKNVEEHQQTLEAESFSVHL